MAQDIANAGGRVDPDEGELSWHELVVTPVMA
jgi:hypothetical protein